MRPAGPGDEYDASRDRVDVDIEWRGFVGLHGDSQHAQLQRPQLQNAKLQYARLQPAGHAGARIVDPAGGRGEFWQWRRELPHALHTGGTERHRYLQCELHARRLSAAERAGTHRRKRGGLATIWRRRHRTDHRHFAEPGLCRARASGANTQPRRQEAARCPLENKRQARGDEAGDGSSGDRRTIVILTSAAYAAGASLAARRARAGHLAQRVSLTWRGASRGSLDTPSLRRMKGPACPAKVVPGFATRTRAEDSGAGA